MYVALTSPGIVTGDANPFARRMQFADKTTLGQSAVLGLLCVPTLSLCIWVALTCDGPFANDSASCSTGTHINQDQFNWLGTIFYLFFLGFEWPQNLALQRLPVGKWMRCAIFRPGVFWPHG